METSQRNGSMLLWAALATALILIFCVGAATIGNAILGDDTPEQTVQQQMIDGYNMAAYGANVANIVGAGNQTDGNGQPVVMPIMPASR